jgi:hypothetical protein
MTEAETHNERLCAHMLGDHTRHAYPCVCANVCMCAWAATILKIRGIQLWQLYDQLFVYDQLFACHFVSKFQRCSSNGLEMAAF